VAQDDHGSLGWQHPLAKVLNDPCTVDVGETSIEDHESWSALGSEMQAQTPAIGDNQPHAVPASGYPKEDDSAFGVPADVEKGTVVAGSRRGVPSFAARVRGRGFAGWFKQVEPRSVILGELRLHASHDTDGR
jgi:hypothetical protein